jgi:plasmid maintenance system antidote protein VapI
MKQKQGELNLEIQEIQELLKRQKESQKKLWKERKKILRKRNNIKTKICSFQKRDSVLSSEFWWNMQRDIDLRELIKLSEKELKQKELSSVKITE